MVEPFGVGGSFYATNNPPTEPTQTAEIPEPTNAKAIFITATSKIYDSKERAPLDVVTGLFTPIKIGIDTFKYQVQTLSSQRVELEIKGLAKLSETAETDHFAEATTRHILRQWKDNTALIIYNVETNFIPSSSTGHSSSKTAIERNQQVCDSENVVVAQVQISVDFKTINPKITEEMIITGAFVTSGTNKYEITLKDSGVESFSFIIKLLEPVIIQPADGPIQGQTHKMHSVTISIKYDEPYKCIVLKQDTSQPLFVKYEVPSKVIMRNDLNLEPPRKLHECTSCTDNATPWIFDKKTKCRTTRIVLTHCH